MRIHLYTTCQGVPPPLALQKRDLQAARLLNVCVCCVPASESHTFLSGNSSYVPLSCCCTWREAQSDTKHEWGGVLLASRMLNECGVKEMEREAIFDHNLPFSLWAGTKGVGRRSRGKIYGESQDSRLKVTTYVTVTHEEVVVVDVKQ